MMAVRKNQGGNTMKKETIEKLDALEELENYSHAFFTTEQAQVFLTPFGINAKNHEQKAKCNYSDPMGLHGHHGEKFLVGISAFSMPSIIASALGIAISSGGFFGRGRTFRYEIEQIVNHIKKD